MAAGHDRSKRMASMRSWSDWFRNRWRASLAAAYLWLGLAKLGAAPTGVWRAWEWSWFLSGYEVVLGLLLLLGVRWGWPLLVSVGTCLVWCAAALLSGDKPCRCMAGIVEQAGRPLRLAVAGALGCVALLAMAEHRRIRDARGRD